MQRELELSNSSGFSESSRDANLSLAPTGVEENVATILKQVVTFRLPPAYPKPDLFDRSRAEH